jgi:hypothetical protein
MLCFRRFTIGDCFIPRVTFEVHRRHQTSCAPRSYPADQLSVCDGQIDPDIPERGDALRGDAADMNVVPTWAIWND